jgi:hypothetical protein
MPKAIRLLLLPLREAKNKAGQRQKAKPKRPARADERLAGNPCPALFMLRYWPSSPARCCNNAKISGPKPDTYELRRRAAMRWRRRQVTAPSD